mgnify:CR=1 FL=1|jgi:hypothetical protein|tara:strand:+ start:7742 stop:8152 length:411 start_codon:yes stop_codon:yes gene_type:complete
MKNIKYIETTLGTDPKNPLCQVRDEDVTYILNYLMGTAKYFSDISQKKADVWHDIIKRLPKHLHKGANGPNSIISFCLGLLTNTYFNIQKYKGQCRISRKQIEDLEFCSKCLHIADAQFEPIRFQSSLIEVAGEMV